MEKGRLVYREETTGLGFFYGFFVFLILIIVGNNWIVWVSGDLSGYDFFISMLFVGFFVFAMIQTYKYEKKIPDFYEHGILLYQNGKPIQFLLYDELDAIQCYYYRSGGKHPKTYYCVVFYQNGKEVERLSFRMISELEEVWKQLLVLHPELNSRLLLKDERSTTIRLYERLMIIEPVY